MEKLVRNLIVNSGEDHNVEIVLYGMQVIVDGMISIFALLLLGIILKKVEPTFIFILFSCLFSRSMGGYHASTRGGCAFVTLCMKQNVRFAELCLTLIHNQKYPTVCSN